MPRRGGNRLAVLLMTGVLVGDLWTWGARWLEMALQPGVPVAQDACDQGSMIDPNGQCRSLLVEPQGFMIDPDGQPTVDQGLMIDPNG
jgi:hypothetical protein